MELHIYYSEYNLIRVTWGEVITLDALCRHFEILKSSKHYPRDLRLITSSQVEQLDFSLTHENMANIAKWRDEALLEYDSIMTAIYDVKPVPSAYVSFYSEFFDSPKSCLREFATEQAALKWLLGGAEAPKSLKV